VAFYYWHCDASSFGSIYFPSCFVDKNCIVIDKNGYRLLPASIGNRASALRSFVNDFSSLPPINYLLNYDHRSIVDCLINCRSMTPRYSHNFGLHGSFFFRYAFILLYEVMMSLGIIGTIINHPFFPLERDQPFVMSFHDAIRPKATFNELAIR